MKNLDQIYFTARELPPEDRPAYLTEACEGDAVLRTRVEQMLAVAGDAEAFIADVPDDGPEERKPARGHVKPPKLESKEAPDEAVGQKLGHYKLLERLGEGGFGVVYVAEQTEPVRRRVALKVIKLGMDTKQVVARFEAERQALAMMDHPNIAKVLDAGTTGLGRPFFVMELVRGVRITDYCDRNNLSTKERLDLFIKVCHAIQHAHQKGIIHRDIKPSNILVTLHDDVPEPRVIDFGVAKPTEGRLTDATVYTQLHQLIGTPAYISPEQAEMSALDVDTRSDIYSLGVLLYELLAGSTPFDTQELLASGLDAMRKTIREKEPVRPSTKLTQALVAAEVTTRASGGAEESASLRRRLQELVHQLKGDLDWIVMKCLEKDRKRRYATANDLAADLQRYLADEPVTARAPSAAYRFQKAFRRNKLIFAAIGAVAGALLLGVIVSTWQAVRAIHARQAEKVQAGLARVDRDRALRAESTAVQQRDLAQQRLYESLVREAQSIRTIRALGFRRQLIDRIQKALAIPTPKKNIDELRTEVAQCLGDPISFDPVNLVDPPSLFLDVALNTDGTLVAYGTAEGKLALHETSSGKVASLLEIKAELAQLAFAPDGRSLYGCARQPDSRAGVAPRVSLMEWRRQRNGSWSQQSERSMPDLRRLVLTRQAVIAVIEDSSKREIRLIDVATDRSIGSVPLVPLVPPVSGQPSTVPFDVTSDDHFAAYVGDSETGQPGTTVEVWDLKANELCIRLTPRLGPVRHLQFSPDLRLLACTMENGVLALETSQFKPVNTYRHLMGGRALWCGDTRLALPLSQENGVRLCTVVAGTEATRLTTQHQVKDVRSSLDGSVLLVIPHTGPTLVVKLTGSRERQHLTGHVGGTAAVEFSPDGRMIASTGKDGVIRIGEAQTGKTRQAWPIPRGNQGQTVGFSPDGRWLASGNYQNNQVLVWDLAEGQRVLTLGDGGPSSQGTWSCGFSQDGRILIAAGDGLRGWELVLRTAGTTGPPLEARELFHHPGETRNLQFDPTGKWIGFEGHSQRNGPSFSGSFIRGLEPGSEPEPISQHKFAVQTFGIDGEGTLLHIDSDRSLVFSNPHSRQSVRRLPTLTTGESVSTFLGNFKISPDGSKVAVANHNGRGVNIQDLAGRRRLYTLPDDEAPIWWLAWHPNGRHLAVARGDGDISLWSLVEVEAALAEVGFAP